MQTLSLLKEIPVRRLVRLETACKTIKGMLPLVVARVTVLFLTLVVVVVRCWTTRVPSVELLIKMLLEVTALATVPSFLGNIWVVVVSVSLISRALVRNRAVPRLLLLHTQLGVRLKVATLKLRRRVVAFIIRLPIVRWELRLLVTLAPTRVLMLKWLISTRVAMVVVIPFMLSRIIMVVPLFRALAQKACFVVLMAAARLTWVIRLATLDGTVLTTLTAPTVPLPNI